MSVTMIGIVFADPRIGGGSELNVMLALADEVREGNSCWPGVELLARKTRMQERAVRKVLTKLEAKGLIQRTTGGGRKYTNRYVLHVEKPCPGGQGNGPENPVPGNTVSAGNPVPQDTLSERNPVPQDRKPCPTGQGNRNEPYKKEGEEGRGRAREAAPAEIRNGRIVRLPVRGEPGTDAAALPLFQRVLDAAGVTKLSRQPSGWNAPAAELHVNRWRDDLGLTPEQIVAVVEAEQARHGHKTPDRPSAYDRPMCDLARELRAPPMQPDETRPHRASGRQPPEPPAIDWQRVWSGGDRK